MCACVSMTVWHKHKTPLQHVENVCLCVVYHAPMCHKEIRNIQWCARRLVYRDSTLQGHLPQQCTCCEVGHTAISTVSNDAMSAIRQASHIWHDHVPCYVHASGSVPLNSLKYKLPRVIKTRHGRPYVLLAQIGRRTVCTGCVCATCVCMVLHVLTS